MARESYGGSPSTASPDSLDSRPRLLDSRISGERPVGSPREGIDSEERERDDDELNEWRHSLPPPEPQLMENQDKMGETQEALMAEILELRSQRRAASAELETVAASLPALEEESLRAGDALDAMRYFYQEKDGDMHRGEGALDYDIAKFANKYHLPGLLDAHGKLPGSPKRRRLVIEEFLQKQILLSHDPEVIRAADGFLNEYRVVLKTVLPLEEEAKAAFLRFNPVQQRAEDLKRQINDLSWKERMRMKRYGELSRVSQEELAVEERRKHKNELLVPANVEALVRALEAIRSSRHGEMDRHDEGVLRQVLEEYVRDSTFFGVLASAVGRSFDHLELEDLLENLLDTKYGYLRRVSQEQEQGDLRQARDAKLFSPGNVKSLLRTFEALRSSPRQAINHRLQLVLDVFLREYAKDPSLLNSLTLALGGKFKKDELEELIGKTSDKKYRRAA